MALTKFEKLMAPALNSFSKDEVLSASEIRKRIAKKEKLTDEQLRERYASIGTLVFLDQAGWAIHCLYKAGLFKQVRRNIYQLSSSGKTLQAEKREMINATFLKTHYPKYRKWYQDFRPSPGSRAQPETRRTNKIADSLSPLDRLENARAEIQRGLESELHRLMQEDISPARFERIAIDLLEAMGYEEDHADSAKVTGGANDGGINVIMKKNALGLNKIYVQAKKYSARHSVNSGKLREFTETLRAKGAAKGVFVTTSRFAPSAREEYSGRDDIVLIDGEELVRLMIQYEVGVARKNYAIKRVDENYFAEERL